MSRDRLVCFEVKIKETHLRILARYELREKARKVVVKYRRDLEKYIGSNPTFLTTYKPFEVDEEAPDIVKEMSRAGRAAGVGPMAAVAGAIAECTGRELLKYSQEVIVENGGDIFIKSATQRRIGILAGESPLSGKLAIVVEPSDTPLGICTSSGTVGHSFSFGSADAAVVISSSVPLADAVATAVGNIVKVKSDIERGLEFCKRIDEVKGVILIKDEKLGVWGDIKMVGV